MKSPEMYLNNFHLNWLGLLEIFLKDFGKMTLKSGVKKKQRFLRNASEGLS